MVPSKVVKAKVKLPADRKTKQDKELEAGMAAALEKEDFYGKKKKQESMKVPAFMEKIGKEAINQKIVEERTKKIRESMKKNPKGVIFKSVEIKEKK